MAVRRTCNRCGHEQMIGYNAVDGRVMWWTACDACGEGDFMARPDPRVMDRFVEAFTKAEPRP